MIIALTSIAEIKNWAIFIIAKENHHIINNIIGIFIANAIYHIV